MQLQKEIIRALGVRPVIDCEQEIIACIDFLKNYLLAHPFIHTLVLGISGGQDSTLTGKLCQLTIESLRQQPNNVTPYRFIAVRLPYGIQADEQDCQDAIQFIAPDRVYTVDIKPAVQASERALLQAGIRLSDYARGNEKARERMKVQYSIAAMNKGIVVGTDHAAEAVTGFFTKYGDGGTDINPISLLNKTQGKMLLKALACPPHLYLKHPTADLEDEKPGLADEIALGVTYADIDAYLEGKTIAADASNRIENWYKKTVHKRHLPVIPTDDYWR